MQNWIPTLFVGLLLVFSYDYAFAGDLSLKENTEKTDVGAQNKKSGNIWFSPNRATSENPAAGKKMDTTHQGKAGIIGDCGLEAQRRMQTQRLHKGMRAGIDASDPCPDPEPVPTPDIKAPPMR